MTARALAAAAALALTLGAGPGLAEPVRVLLIVPGAADPVAASLLDELVALGLIVEVEASTQGDLPALARARSARAALRVDGARRAVEIWDPGSASVIRVEAQPEEPGGAAAGLALRAVELLRGRLIEVPAPPAAAPAAAAPSRSAPAVTAPPVGAPAVDAPPAAAPAPAPTIPSKALAPGASRAPGADAAPGRRVSIALHAGPSVVLQPGSAISPEGAATAGARWRFTDRLDGEVIAVIPIVPATIDSRIGRARLSTAVVGAGASIGLLDPRLPVAMRAGAGAGAGFLRYHGQSWTGDARGREGTAPYALPFVRWDIGWQVHPALTLRAEALSGIAAPRPVIRLPGRSDVPFGRPLLAFNLVLEAGIR
ncbi:uncharacterized protein SOCE26_088520 [Sorangium cellulosum]|uniref:Secreted protein n=1 Tax=Sorangium cellulosum TaxID=56 RepID=A0A2L0F722_SORCE|nr:hypothetical protein [Sorangium cellulosum]AUX47333.1 uncharacterized protein SOCE26_088520 [Sorangium cellulosum]